jgi:C4-dicarboxylate-specific signal transduction histidine kinase
VVNAAASAVQGAARPRHRRWTTARRLLLGTAAAALVASCAWLGFTTAESQGIAELKADSDHRLELFSSAVQGVIQRLEHVPSTIQLNHEVLDLLQRPDAPATRRAGNEYLRRLNAYLASMAVFVMNDRGVVVASSNADKDDDSLLGQDLAFRPYFVEALSGRVGRHFAIGINGGEPGYFVSHPIRDGARVVGVATIKIGLQGIAQTWDMLGARALVADTNQVVIMSSQPEWLYTSLVELPLDLRVDLQLTRMYNNRRLARFPLPVRINAPQDEAGQVMGVSVSDDGSARQRPDDPGTLVLSRTLDGMDWRLMTFSDLRAVRSQAIVYSVMSAVAASFVMLLGLYLAQRQRILRQRNESRQMLERANAELEHNVASRTLDLTAANLRLRREVAERERAEQTLRDAQDELVHSAKMAMLGQLATGITHELTQPLGAIRTLSGNASEFMRRGDMDALSGNLGIIERLADQMGGIIQPLKGFARKSRPVPVKADVAHALGNALFLYESRLRHDGVEVVNRCRPGITSAWCDPNRLEQVLINLIGNAIDAMQSSDVRRLTLESRIEPVAASLDTDEPAGGERVRIDVLDSGPGIGEAALARLFEPFYSTKPQGAGLGLGLAISRDIVHEFGGDITATNRAEGGARFSLTLPVGPALHRSHALTPA